MAPVPIKIISHKLDQVMRDLMHYHYKMGKLDSVQEVTRTVFDNFINNRNNGG